MKQLTRVSGLLAVVLVSACAAKSSKSTTPAFTGRPKDRVDEPAPLTESEPEIGKTRPTPASPTPERSRAATEVVVITLRPPPWVETLAPGNRPPPKVKLRQLSSKKNKINDDNEWLERNELQLPGTPTPGAPTDFAGVNLDKTFQSDNLIHLFQDYASGPSYLQVHGADGLPQILFDFTNWRTPPGTLKGEERYVTGGIFWAATRGDVLYVAYGHMTYAESSMGENAYVTALSLKDGSILWNSRPLVSNARSFAMFDKVLVTGYGFTEEPDFLYALDLDTGAVVAKQKVASAPTWIVRKENELLVRTYDHDYTFQVDVN